MNFGKNPQHDFPKMRGGSMAVWNFPKIHPFWTGDASLSITCTSPCTPPYEVHVTIRGQHTFNFLLASWSAEVMYSLQTLPKILQCKLYVNFLPKYSLFADTAWHICKGRCALWVCSWLSARAHTTLTWPNWPLRRVAKATEHNGGICNFPIKQQK